jgi:hypothetical protein
MLTELSWRYIPDDRSELCRHVTLNLDAAFRNMGWNNLCNESHVYYYIQPEGTPPFSDTRLYCTFCENCTYAQNILRESFKYSVQSYLFFMIPVFLLSSFLRYDLCVDLLLHLFR